MVVERQDECTGVCRGNRAHAVSSVDNPECEENPASPLYISLPLSPRMALNTSIRSPFVPLDPPWPQKSPLQSLAATFFGVLPPVRIQSLLWQLAADRRVQPHSRSRALPTSTVEENPYGTISAGRLVRPLTAEMAMSRPTRTPVGRRTSPYSSSTASRRTASPSLGLASSPSAVVTTKSMKKVSHTITSSSTVYSPMASSPS